MERRADVRRPPVKPLARRHFELFPLPFSLWLLFLPGPPFCFYLSFLVGPFLCEPRIARITTDVRETLERRRLSSLAFTGERGLPLSRLNRCSDGKWVVISKIGEGGFGFVYKAKNVISAKEVALKLAKSEDDGPILLFEATIMEQLDHQNIVKVVDIPIRLPDSNRVALVLEYVKGASLDSIIHHLRRDTERGLWFPMEQMADAVVYLHSQNIVHRDIKPENVLYSNRGIVKLIDFNLSKRFIHGKKLYDACGTPGFMAPEITAGCGYEGPPVDVWALGILFKKLFVGLQFDGRNIIKMSYDKTDFNVGKSSPTFARKTSVSLLTAMLWKNPMKRLTMREVVNHAWFKENHPGNF
uniref:probable serine/threonine-protein kinase MARK-C n=1 Tax=Myxine glutinosa TaxID=7769 RepID=UPI00358FC17E